MPCVPFHSAMNRDIHFRRHGREFGATSPEEYESMADAFMFGPMDTDTHECVRPNRRLRNRMNFVTIHFGVGKVRDGILCTFYIPKRDTIARHGGVAQLFSDYCARAD